jgi:hypothetical protein
MAIFNAHHGGTKFATIGECVKASLGCISPESINQISTVIPFGQSQITLAQVLGNLRENKDKLAVGDIITTNVIPTQSYLEGVAVDLACKLDGYEFEFVTVKQNGVDAANNPAFTVAALGAGDLHTSSYATVAGVTTNTVTDAADAPPAFGATATKHVYSPDYNTNYFGSWGALGLKVTALPAASSNCKANTEFGTCTSFTATWRNIQPCIRKCSDLTCSDKGADVVVLA